ncbi:MAG: alanine--tRNA ligase [Chloroflexi bacterium RBG_13_51_36]|nr:MAG: alanine--tRNA ligase [Chloroflexi bacterium RBG_13_51_36]
MTGDELRQAFLSFFQNRGHKIIPSSSLVPHKDPTLLLTSAGMVQIKPYYLGLETPPGPRLASCQKCFRTTDIDSVGDSKHLTFFEMLGNFSVGDYFKKETIAWAWEFVSRYLKLPEERLWITIYLDDDDAFAYWREIGIPAGKILRFGAEDNFWGPVGDSGPCGPCSEIHYDLGEEFGCGKAECGPNCGCGRFSEIWNLVFTQYNQGKDGQRTRLPKPNIDTGMGLERTLAVIQGKSTPYETNLFSPLIDHICSLSDKAYGRDENADRAIRIVAEHSRGIAFLIADGVMPSNEGRGYVLRRILRRAALFGRKLGLDGPFLNAMAEVVVGTMSHIYPELTANQSLIDEVIRVEEGKFIATLDSGLNLVEKVIGEASAQGRNELTSDEIFRLYDTYGFPAELTAEIARERGLTIDWEGFQAEMEKQRKRARAARKAGVTVGLKVEASAVYTRGGPEFVGDRTLKHRSTVAALLLEGKSLEDQVNSACQGQNVRVVLRATPFYGEMGGQVGDIGEIRGERGKIVVSDTVRYAVKGKERIVHLGKVVEGQISVKDSVEAEVEQERRLDIACNHTATHLLQAALRQILGSRVYQKGSLVGPDRFRFDFSHMASITNEELKGIQRQVNEWIRQNLKVKSRRLSYTQAVAEGAIALFEEKYGDEVRMLEIGEPPISKELCGGTHVSSTGQIGMFMITNESSIGTGLHRIEALTGRKAESLIESRLTALEDVAKQIESSLDEVSGKVKVIIDELEVERKRALALERELSRRIAEDLLGQAQEVSGVKVLVARVQSLTVPTLREMGDMLRERLKSAVIVLATVYNGKPNFLAMVTPDLIAKGFHAGDIINQVAKVTGGGGGGKAGMAQAGGRDTAKTDEALKLVHKLIQKV